jgi:hypothetical protein
MLHKASGINPLWTPPWRSIEPSQYSPAAHPEFGSGSDARLLAGIMGHNLCLDIFGGPSDEEAAAGIPAHGEASVAEYDVAVAGSALVARATLTVAQIAVERRIQLEESIVHIHETVANLSGLDRPIGWTQHVTLGPPFLQKGVTEFRASATRSKVFEGAFGSHDYLRSGVRFEWPLAPALDGRRPVDLRRLADVPASTAYTAHRMDPERTAFFVAFSAAARLAIGYVWNPSDFPWMGIWEENASRTHSPWSGRVLARGMEFGVSPFPESRREMVDRGPLFETPTFRWLPARSSTAVDYCAIVRAANHVPESLEWPS